MIAQRTTPALRQLARSSYPTSRVLAPLAGRRMQSTGTHTPDKPKAKLVRDVMDEARGVVLKALLCTGVPLWPKGRAY
jgi:hypothetical protein